MHPLIPAPGQSPPSPAHHSATALHTIDYSSNFTELWLSAVHRHPCVSLGSLRSQGNKDLRRGVWSWSQEMAIREWRSETGEGRQPEGVPWSHLLPLVPGAWSCPATLGDTCLQSCPNRGLGNWGCFLLTYWLKAASGGHEKPSGRELQSLEKVREWVGHPAICHPLSHTHTNGEPHLCKYVAQWPGCVLKEWGEICFSRRWVPWEQVLCSIHPGPQGPPWMGTSGRVPRAGGCLCPASGPSRTFCGFTSINKSLSCPMRPVIGWEEMKVEGLFPAGPPLLGQCKAHARDGGPGWWKEHGRGYSCWFLVAKWQECGCSKLPGNCLPGNYEEMSWGAGPKWALRWNCSPLESFFCN